ncbi:hypothetical protein [Xenorhabdus bovienii]|uniref:hypothetical protein n=1 Tax=Xenorhabdus bovienii TaxID=40576 RepID=UPI002157B467|nr:hypothetical protein [Xenorhabdus bovienii]
MNEQKILKNMLNNKVSKFNKTMFKFGMITLSMGVLGFILICFSFFHIRIGVDDDILFIVGFLMHLLSSFLCLVLITHGVKF